MTPHHTTIPAPTTATALFGLWRVDGPDHQDATIDAIHTAWRSRPWPGPGLASYSVLACDDGHHLLHVSQTTDPNAATGQDLTWKRDVDTAEPGIHRLGVTPVRLHRSTPTHEPIHNTGCIVFVTRVFDGPDIDRANTLVDTMFAAGEKARPAPGMISANFYVSLDGIHIYNHALWTSSQAHHTAIDNPPKTLADSDEWQQAHAWPGLLSTTFQRYTPRLHLIPQ
ncbi:hypothetical protein [Nocardia sp. CA-290969]|uniref:hypothetical protein n=1 Tax=Nocardia sp. CA-290969 TaxID=3239986 RepID=UPI003D8AA58E